jgi:SpoVK/Ycf46/Vps4 family AAA+-type ATPase
MKHFSDSAFVTAVAAAAAPDLWSRIEQLRATDIERREAPLLAAAKFKNDVYQKIVAHGQSIIEAIKPHNLFAAIDEDDTAAVQMRQHNRPETWISIDPHRSYRMFLLRGVDGAKRQLCMVRPGEWDDYVLTWSNDDAHFPDPRPLMLLEITLPVPQQLDAETIDVYLYADHFLIRGLSRRFDGQGALDVLRSLPEMVKLLADIEARPLLASSAQSPLRPVSELQTVWQDIALPDAIKEAVVVQQALFSLGDRACGRGLLLKGAPGTGKTHLAKVFAAASGAQFFHLTEADLKSASIGGSAEAVKAMWARALAAGRAVLFLDECEGLFGRRGGLEGDVACAEALRTLLPLWDGLPSASSVFVIGATNRPELLDAAILSRFGGTLELPLPDAATRLILLDRALQNYALSVDGLEAETEAVQRATIGLSGRDLDDIAMRLRRMTIGRAPTVTDLLTLLSQRRMDGNTPVDPKATWDRLVVPAVVKDALLDVSFLLTRTETLSTSGFKCPAALLLYGPPGTGKTQCARTLANEAGAHFIAASTAELKAGFIGQSGQRVKQLFETARAHAPCIVFLDEIDAVASHRGANGSDSFSVEVLNQLLQELDGIRDPRGASVVVIAATNRRDVLDAALQSRFVDLLEVPLPDTQARLKLLRIALEAIDASDEAIAALENWARDADSGAVSHRDIDQCLQRVLRQAVRRMRVATQLRSVSTSAELTGSRTFCIEFDDVATVIRSDCLKSA